MNKIIVWQDSRFGDLRMIEIKTEPWFMATDVCRALEIKNPSQAISRLEDDERMTVLISNEGAATGKSMMAFINEPGLYTLVLGSRKKEAKEFKRWVTHEILPSIRRNGFYSTMTDEQLYELLGKRIKSNQEVVLREYERINPSTIKSVIPLSVMTERVVVKKTEPPVYPTI